MVDCPVHVSMDTADWLKSIVQEECGMNSSSSPTGELISGSRPPPPPPAMELRLRPQHDQPLKCPRCDSTHTKFCYYNNYSLSQPRYFCKTCRRYWTKGGSLRNVPVGGGCRKNKRPSGKKAAEPPLPMNSLPVPTSFRDGAADLHLSSFPALQLSHLGSLTAGTTHYGLDHMECKYDAVFDGHGDAADGGEFGTLLPRNLLFMGGGDVRGVGGLGELSPGFPSSSSSSSFLSPLGFPVDGNHNSVFMNACQKLQVLPHDEHEDVVHGSVEMKPSGKLLSLEWQFDQVCGDVGREGFRYSSGLGLWAGIVNGHGSSTSNPLI